MSKIGVVYVLTYGGDVLLMLRDNNPNINLPVRWELPARALEGGDSPAESAQRGLMIEFGLRDVPLTEIGTSPKGHVFFYAELESSHVPKRGLGQAFAHGFFSTEAIEEFYSLGVGGKGQLGGVLTTFVKENFAEFRKLIKEGVFPTGAF
ncbi:MAG TPA: NUDIX domain-containing protein, partial [Coxiellaceae bacterium]|nr:NUDIX domain-containing protein [Coxiellaceae bacterium]